MSKPTRPDLEAVMRFDPEEGIADLDNISTGCKPVGGSAGL